MGKYLSILAVGALAFTACTSENVVEDVSTSPITFRNVVSKPSRATDVTSGNMEQFNVFGFYTMPGNENHAHAVFTNTPVKTSDSGATWYYEDATRYWVIGATYYFYAYSCGSVSELKEKYGKFSVDMENDANDGEGLPASQRVLKITDYICNNAHQHDLVFASNTKITPTAGYRDDVSLDFKHILTKVQARFTNTFSSEYKVVVKDVQFRNICNTGDYDFTQGWKDVRRAESAEINKTVSLMDAIANEPVKESNYITIENKKVDDKQVYGESKTAFVLPKNYSDNSNDDVTLYVVIDVMYNDDAIISNKVLTATLEPVWESGKYYIYNIELNPNVLNMDGITFGVISVSGWDSPAEDDIDVKP